MPLAFRAVVRAPAFAAAAVLACAATPVRASAQSTANPAGLYDAVRYKGKPLPAIDQLGAPLFESAQGKWVRRGNVVTFVPQKGKKSPPTRPITGTLVNGGMVVRYEMVTPQGEVVPLRVEFRKTGD